jgi:3-hydroxyisobutyrate dehydrogenase-like beta-hydroxyacid dehydrogenase
MVRRLVAAGHDVRVVARSEASRAELAAEGFDVTDDLGDADLVVVCVLTDEQVREAVPARVPAGATVVVHTTASPSTVTMLAETGFHVIDAPVSGGPHDIAAGRVTLFVGGADEDVARVEPILASYGDPIIHCGELGAGQRVKLVNNALFAANLGLLADAARLGTHWGLDEPRLLTALTHGSANSRALAGAAARGTVGAFIQATASFVDKDVRTVRAVIAELGGELGAIDPALHATEHTTGRE